jgi:hypothetical protein
VRFVSISEKDQGIYDAMNKGTAMVTQSWLHFLNSDDFYANDFVLENLQRELDEEYQVIYGRVINFDDGKEAAMSGIQENKLKFNLLFVCPGAQPATFYQKSLFDSGYKFDISYKISADYKLFVELIQARKQFKFIPRYITWFSANGISTHEQNYLALEEDQRLLHALGLFAGFTNLRKYPMLFKITLWLLRIYKHL